MRSVHFGPVAWEHFLFCLSSDRRMARRITRLIGEIQRDPFTGIGAHMRSQVPGGPEEGQVKGGLERV